MFDIITYALVKKYTDNKIAEKLTSVYDYKGSVETFSDLDYYSSTAKVGDTYNVLDEGGQNYAWNGTTWDSLGVNQDATNERKGLIKLTDNIFTDTTLEGDTVFIIANLEDPEHPHIISVDDVLSFTPYFDDNNYSVYMYRGAIFNDNNYSVYIANNYITEELPNAEEEVF